MKVAVFFIVGILFIIFGILSIKKSKSKLARCTEFISGKVIDINENYEEDDSECSRKKISYVPVFQYIVNGKEYVKTSNVSSYNKNDYKIGDIAEILYNPSKPEEFLIKGKSTKSSVGFGIAMLLMGAAIIVIGITQI